MKDNKIPAAIGRLSPNNLLLKVFPKGYVPLKSPLPVEALLGEGPGQFNDVVFLLDKEMLTEKEIRGIAEIALERSTVSSSLTTVEDIIKDLNSVSEFPIRARNIVGLAVHQDGPFAHLKEVREKVFGDATDEQHGHN